MSHGPRAPWWIAHTAAQALERALAPWCERTLIAGGLRRQTANVGDIELVVIPRTAPQYDLFGAPTGQAVSLLDDALPALGIGARRTDGPRLKQFAWQGLPVDLFLVTPDTWGCVATLRTGSADFSRWLVTPRRHGGACPAAYRFHEGRLWQDATPLATPEEADVFRVLEIAWVAPDARQDGRWRR